MIFLNSEYSEGRICKYKVPQGSVLRPLPFIYKIEDFVKNATSNGKLRRAVPMIELFLKEIYLSE